MQQNWTFEEGLPYEEAGVKRVKKRVKPAPRLKERSGNLAAAGQGHGEVRGAVAMTYCGVPDCMLLLVARVLYMMVTLLMLLPQLVNQLPVI